MIRFKQFLREQVLQNIWIDPKNKVHSFSIKITHGDWLAKNVYHREFRWGMFAQAFRDGWVRMKNEEGEVDIDGTKKALVRAKLLWLRNVNDYCKYADDCQVEIEVEPDDIASDYDPTTRHRFVIPREMNSLRAFA